MQKRVAILFFLTCTLSMVGCRNMQQPNAGDVTVEVQDFSLSEVKLLPSPFSHAFQKGKEWLLSLSPDRLLHRFHAYAGLAPKDSIYGGWESRGISGHSLGHYLSAVSMAYAVDGDKEMRSRSQYIVSELARCQQEFGNGYVGAIPEQDRIFSEIAAGKIYSSGFDLNGGWVPWYTQHKVFAGLADAYKFTGNEEAKAVLIKLSDWACDLSDKLTDEQFQQMLACEHGGMNETLAYLYEVTGEKKYLQLSLRFNHQQIINPLLARQDKLIGLHANTQIPKVVGVAAQYEQTGDTTQRGVAEFFWNTVVQHHSYANGGNSDHEHFGMPDDLKGRLSIYSSETCNTYNMLKLTKMLFKWEPSADKGDYYERALYNHILASQNPETGMVCYYMNHQPGGKKKFSSPFNDFWCCVGTGWENHLKYGESIYFHKDDKLFVNLFIPSVLEWKDQNASITLETEYPKEKEVSLTLALDSPKKLEIKLRKPDWLASSPELEVNGKAVKVEIGKDGFVTLNRTWKNGDRITYTMPMNIHAESLLGDTTKKAFLYGPLLLAADLGDQNISEYHTPSIVADNQEPLLAMEDVSTLTFSTANTGRPTDLKFRPFNQLNKQGYMLYTDVLNEQQWEAKQELANTLLRKKQYVQEHTVDRIRIGEMQPERDHNLKGEKTVSGGLENKWRHAEDGGWFSFELATEGKPNNLGIACRYWGSDSGGRKFDIMVEGVVIKTKELVGELPNRYFYEYYIIPDNLLKNKEKVEVKFQAYPSNIAGGLYDCRLMEITDTTTVVQMLEQ
ncbi:glycoside hydrolase family 127 protein [Limibacter armeniacum]|uniref:glycoside hydrolase family 127 protein n=1 Tax=Limibacter armeniacum TaxID=466084 RepID=UPI002FE6431F